MAHILVHIAEVSWFTKCLAVACCWWINTLFPSELHRIYQWCSLVRQASSSDSSLLWCTLQVSLSIMLHAASQRPTALKPHVVWMLVAQSPPTSDNWAYYCCCGPQTITWCATRVCSQWLSIVSVLYVYQCTACMLYTMLCALPLTSKCGVVTDACLSILTITLHCIPGLMQLQLPWHWLLQPFQQSQTTVHSLVLVWLWPSWSHPQLACLLFPASIFNTDAQGSGAQRGTVSALYFCMHCSYHVRIYGSSIVWTWGYIFTQ